MDDFAKRGQIVFLQLRLQLPRQPDHFDHRFLLCFLAGDGVLLCLQDGRRAARDAGVKNNQAVFQLPDGFALADDGLDGLSLIHIFRKKVVLRTLPRKRKS